MRLSFGQEFRPEQRQEQRQILAPRMIQSMEILQLPLMALQERIQQEMEENPVLGIEERDPDLPDPDYEHENSDAPTEEERELVVDEKHKEDDFDRLVSMSEDWGENFEENSRPSANRVQQDADRQHDMMANITSSPQTLKDHLRDQLGWYDLEPAVRQMAERIISCLDTNGYLRKKVGEGKNEKIVPLEIEELLDTNAGPEDLAVAQAALHLVQSLDPPGIAARDLRECLLLQLRPDMHYFEELQTLITSHLEDIKDNRLPLIQRKTGYSLELIQDVLDHLRMLKPKPGTDFNSETAPPVTPDLFVEPVEGGHYRVRMEDRDVPQLYISPYYQKLLRKAAENNETKEYIKKKINSALWLIESIEQRRNTLSRVAQAIIDHQTEFLDKGPEFIEPLKMQQIADKVGVHVTTVSRAVDKKWIQTPRGMFSLKRFFGGGTVSASGESVAWDAIRLKLQEVVDSEDKQHPFSDDELVKELAKHGLKVARRTITKYRQAMDIPSSRQRREWQNNGDSTTSSTSRAATSPASSPALSSTPQSLDKPVEPAAAPEKPQHGFLPPLKFSNGSDSKQ